MYNCKACGKKFKELGGIQKHWKENPEHVAVNVDYETVNALKHIYG